MSDVKQFSLFTYDDEVEAGYLYLTFEFAHGLERSSYTEELHPEIFLDFNNEDKLIGVEFLASTSKMMRAFADKDNVFQRKLASQGDDYVDCFRVSKAVIKGTVRIKEQPIVFLFEDEECMRFAGVTIFPEQ